MCFFLVLGLLALPVVAGVLIAMVAIEAPLALGGLVAAAVVAAVWVRRFGRRSGPPPAG